jgi:hypothetical protein
MKKIKVTPYIKIMEKFNLTREEVESEATAKNVSLPDNCFDEVTMDKKEATRGRPKKEEPIVELDNDTILELAESSLLEKKVKSEVKKSEVKKPVKNSVVEDDEDNEESVCLRKFKFQNVLYYKRDNNGFIYDYAITRALLANGEDIHHIGIWNKNENRIDRIDNVDWGVTSSVEGDSEEEEEEEEYE